MASRGDRPLDPSRKALEELVSGEEGLDIESLTELTERLATEKVDKILRYRNPAAVETLRHLCGSYHGSQPAFKVGDIVRWKEGLKNKRHPAYDQPAVVWEILDPPRVNSAESSGSQYFHEQLDLMIAYFLEDDDLGVFHVDGRRFEHHPNFQPSEESGSALED
jgi:hypothetical protein